METLEDVATTVVVLLRDTETRAAEEIPEIVFESSRFPLKKWRIRT